MTGRVFRGYPAAGTTWTRTMFERQVLGDGLLGEAGRDPSDPLSLRRADGEMRWCAARFANGARCFITRSIRSKRTARPIENLLPARGRPGQSLRDRNPEDRGASERGKAVPELCPVEEQGQTFMI